MKTQSYRNHYARQFGWRRIEGLILLLMNGMDDEI